MSGPKSSSYTLSYEQRRILEEEERKKVEMESQRKQLNVQRLSEGIDKISAQIRRLEELQRESGHSVPFLTETRDTITTIKNTIRTAMKKEKKRATAELQLHSDQGFQYTSQAYF